MADYGSVLALLVDLEQKIQQIKDELGKLQAQMDIGLVDTGLLGFSGAAAVIPPSRSEEIVGGEETDEFPDCCAVGNAEAYTCSGTLIASNVVVTADHCRSVSQVFLKGNDVSKPDAGETIAVLQAISHPEVDLKVLVLAHASQVQPRRVAQGSDVTTAKTAMLAGFGTIDLHGTLGYGIKRRLAIEIPITSVDCGEPDAPKLYGCLSGRELVAGHRGLRLDSCQGDSGGPLYIQGSDGEYYLLGATSRGVRNGFTSCGDGGVYVRVDLCLDWIRHATGAEIWTQPLSTSPG